MTNIKPYLLKGIPKKNIDTQKLEIYSSDSNSLIYSIQFTQLNARDLGIVYERLVGLYYENLGYEVEYRGIIKGVLDNGIDLVCKSEQENLCIQCKYIHRGFSLQEVEWILYKASLFFSKNKFDIKPTFIIMVPKLKTALYPKMTEYILSKNYTQNFVHIELKELDLL